MAPSANVGLIATPTLADDADISPEQQRDAETTVDARPSTLADDEDIASPEQQRNAETTADDVTRDDDVV